MSQISALLQSVAQLQRSSTLLLAEVARQRSGGNTAAFRPAEERSVVDDRPASARASIMVPGAPIPARGAQQDHAPRTKVLARTKARLFKDGWPDCEDTDSHADRLTEAMLRLGMEDLDNFATEASRLNCSNMAITATLVSAIVATFVSTTYDNNTTAMMQVVNALWLVSLLLSLAVATLCMLVSEWLTWSTSQELRDLSPLYRMVRTAIRSLLMHLSIFFFFAGLMVLVCNVAPLSVWISPILFLFFFGVYYVVATVRAPFKAFFRGVNQFDEQDHRGLRVQVWTPFTLGTHHLFNYCRIYISLPTQQFLRSMTNTERKSRGERERDSQAMTDEYGPQNLGQSFQMNTPGETSQEKDGVMSNRANPSRVSVASNATDMNAEKEGAEARDFQYEDAVHEDQEFRDKIRATRLRRLREHEVMRPGQRARQVLKNSDDAEITTQEVHF